MSEAPAAIDFANLRFRYRTGPEVLSIPSLLVPSGQKVFLHGPSGSGKTTLLGIIAGVLSPTSSDRTEVLGQEMATLSPGARDAFRGEHLGYLFQLFNLLPWLSVIDNVTLPVKLHDVRNARLDGATPDDVARGLLDRLGMTQFVDTPVTDLSVGQQQRVAAARALIGRPSLLIADEPTSALDTDRRDQFLELLFQECDAAGATLLFVSHDLSLGERFDERLSLPELNQQLVA